ncbi:hypothetical protein CEXT_633741 [Caerostris extrusa]|uniref:Uncharacterized protein n=1 Tax=Caerostris extrusa TaxID=172846 RepID=A0AAV4UNG2_CAEEX|nr:hypothetical protein CEXT_633741 [Caerostris extrusa]
MIAKPNPHNSQFPHEKTKHRHLQPTTVSQSLQGFNHQAREEEDFQLSRSETDNGRTWAQLCRALTQACIIQQVPATKSKIENPLGRDRRKDALEEKDYPEIIRFNGTPTSGINLAWRLAFGSVGLLVI